MGLDDLLAAADGDQADRDDQHLLGVVELHQHEPLGVEGDVVDAPLVAAHEGVDLPVADEGVLFEEFLDLAAIGRMVVVVEDVPPLHPVGGGDDQGVLGNDLRPLDLRRPHPFGVELGDSVLRRRGLGGGGDQKQ